MTTKIEKTVYIIAEAGVNHNGSMIEALKMVDIARSCGADAIKFQTFISKKLTSEHALMAQYQSVNTNNAYKNQLDMLSELELTKHEFRNLKKECESKGLDFIASPFDPNSLNFLLELNCKVIKFGSGEITNLMSLLHAGRGQRNIIISTGMARLSEIEMALAAISWGRFNSGFPSSSQDLMTEFWASYQKFKNDNFVTLLHCTSEYPAPNNELNLNAIQRLKSYFELPIGFSDHSIGHTAALGAVAVGAKVLEKHFTLNKKANGPDHTASMEPSEFKSFVMEIRQLENMLGTGLKHPTLTETKNILPARKSLFARNRIKKGDVIVSTAIEAMRPGSGKSADRIFDVIGSTANQDYEIGDFIK